VEDRGDTDVDDLEDDEQPSAAERFPPGEEISSPPRIDSPGRKSLEREDIVKEAVEKPDNQDQHIAVDISLPGTPLSSDTSSCSLASTLSRIRAAQATPSNVNLDERDAPASV